MIFMITSLGIATASAFFSFFIWAKRGGFYSSHRVAEFVLAAICAIVFIPCLIFIIGDNLGVGGFLLIGFLTIFSFHMSGRFFPSQEFSEAIISIILMVNAATFLHLAISY